jgi:hypothetical protein
VIDVCFLMLMSSFLIVVISLCAPNNEEVAMNIMKSLSTKHSPIYKIYSHFSTTTCLCIACVFLSPCFPKCVQTRCLTQTHVSCNFSSSKIGCGVVGTISCIHHIQLGLSYYHKLCKVK